MNEKTNRSLRAGVIGLGGMGNNHCKAYGRIAEVELAAACDRDEERRREFAKENAAARVYSDAGEMLSAEKLDIVSIAANTPSNLALTRLAVEAGVKRIMCEKPMAHSVQAAREMISLCAANGVRLAIDHTRRWSERHRKLRDLIGSGIIGEVSTMICVSGGACFGCIATHYLDLARMLTGHEMVSVSGMVDDPLRPNPRGEQFFDPGACCLVRFDDGSRLFLDLGEKIGVLPKWEIYGTLGRISVEESAGKWTVEAREGADRERPPYHYSCPLKPADFPQGPWGTGKALETALRELSGDGPISSTGEDGCASLEAVVACHLSHERGGAAVALPLSGEDVKREFTFT